MSDWPHDRINTHAPGLLAHKSRPESVVEKVELIDRVSTSPTFIPAVDDFSLVGRKRQPAVSKTRVQSSLKSHRLVLGPTMTDRVVSIPLKRNVREIPTHPHIKRIVKKEVCQEGLITPPCGVPRSLATRSPSGICTGAFSHHSMYKSTRGQSVCLRTARISRSGSMLSKKVLISRSRTQL